MDSLFVYIYSRMVYLFSMTALYMISLFSFMYYDEFTAAIAVAIAGLVSINVDKVFAKEENKRIPSETTTGICYSKPMASQRDALANRIDSLTFFTSGLSLFLGGMLLIKLSLEAENFPMAVVMIPVVIMFGVSSTLYLLGHTSEHLHAYHEDFAPGALPTKGDE